MSVQDRVTPFVFAQTPLPPGTSVLTPDPSVMHLRTVGLVSQRMPPLPLQPVAWAFSPPGCLGERPGGSPFLAVRRKARQGAELVFWLPWSREACGALVCVPKWSRRAGGQRRRNASSPSWRALWSELRERSSMRPERVGGRSELLEGQTENQIKKKPADTVCRAVWAGCNRIAAWVAAALFSPRLLLPAGWWASLLFMWHIPVHRSSPHAGRQATHTPPYGAAPRPSAYCVELASPEQGPATALPQTAPSVVGGSSSLSLGRELPACAGRSLGGRHHGCPRGRRPLVLL